jgi:hypothetical protein
LLAVTLSLDIYEGIYDFEDRIHIIVGFARCFRVLLFYVLMTSFLYVLNEKCRKNTKFEITSLQKISSLDKLLREMLNKVRDKDPVLKIGLTRSIVLAKKLKSKAQTRNQLQDISMASDKMEIDPEEIKDLNKRDIDKRINSLSRKSEAYFSDVFDFITMEQEYTLKMILESVRDLEFDIFDLETKSDGNELYILTMHLMQKEGYMKEFGMGSKKLKNFAYTIQNEYRDVTYHNKTHGSDVCQTSYYFLFTCDFITTAKMDRLEQMTMLIAGVVHDVDHPGYNNLYMINTKSPLAIRYNDVAVLENYHVATAFKIMLGHEDCNILDGLSKEDFVRARKSIITFVLSTDMSRHFGDMGKFKNRVEAEDFNPKGDDKKLAQEFLFHMADISNPTKPWPLCKKWTDLLFIEFFQQGDRERELGIDISFLMDRTTTNVAKAQDGFIKNLIRPAFVSLQKMLPGLSLNIKYMDENVDKWATKVIQYSNMTHSHMETIKSKKMELKDEEEKVSESDDSFIKNDKDELGSNIESNFNSEHKLDFVSC